MRGESDIWFLKESMLLLDNYRVHILREHGFRIDSATSLMPGSEQTPFDRRPYMKELPPCPVETTLLMIGDKWKVLIIRELLQGTRRFGEIKKSVGGVSQKVLTDKLRDLEGDGLVSRKVYPEVPPKVEYSLTDLGRTLSPVLDTLEEWGLMYKAYAAERATDGYRQVQQDILQNRR